MSAYIGDYSEKVEAIEKAVGFHRGSKEMDKKKAGVADHIPGAKKKVK